LISLGESKDQEGDSTSLIYEMKSPELNIDLCIGCKKPVEEANVGFQNYHWHNACMTCAVCERELSLEIENSAFDPNLAQILCVNHKTQRSSSGFRVVSQLQQYVFLLRCALKRLCLQLKVTSMFLDFNSFS
jgi:hypothetical protein